MQIILNDTARYILRCGRRKMVAYLMETCGFLSISQLVVFHSTLTLWKLLQLSPDNFLMIDISNRKTRYGRTLPDNKLHTRAGQKIITENCWRQNSVSWWNTLPSNLRSELRLKPFKAGLRKWVGENVPIKLY